MKPVAAISVNHTSGIAPLGCVFNDVSTGGAVSGRVWSFGDGATSNKKSPHHEYQGSGDFTATLTVWNAEGSSSATVSVQVTANDEPAPLGSESTLMDLIPATRRLLRSPSDAKLHYTSIIETLLDVLRGYSRDLAIADFDDQKDENPARLAYLADENYLLYVENSPELEIVSLEFASAGAGDVRADAARWINLPLVPLNYYSERNMRETPIAALYGGLTVDAGTKIKINLPREFVESAKWRVITRFPILQQIEMRSPIKLRQDFVRMLKVETAIKLLPQIRDDSENFMKWMPTALKLYSSELADWRSRWKEYLEDVERPQFAPKIPANEYRKPGYYRKSYLVERWKT